MLQWQGQATIFSCSAILCRVIVNLGIGLMKGIRSDARGNFIFRCKCYTSKNCHSIACDCGRGAIFFSVARYDIDNNINSGRSNSISLEHANNLIELKLCGTEYLPLPPCFYSLV